MILISCSSTVKSDFTSDACVWCFYTGGGVIFAAGAGALSNCTTDISVKFFQYITHLHVFIQIINSQEKCICVFFSIFNKVQALIFFFLIKVALF